jgi:hypothetical protein
MIKCEHDICTVYGEEERGVVRLMLATCDSCGAKVEGDIN